MSTEQRAFLLDADEEGNAIVYAALTHDNRFVGVFATRDEALRSPLAPLDVVVIQEVIEPLVAPTARQQEGRPDVD